MYCNHYSFYSFHMLPRSYNPVISDSTPYFIRIKKYIKVRDNNIFTILPLKHIENDDFLLIREYNRKN